MPTAFVVGGVGVGVVVGGVGGLADLGDLVDDGFVVGIAARRFAFARSRVSCATCFAHGLYWLFALDVYSPFHGGMRRLGVTAGARDSDRSTTHARSAARSVRTTEGRLKGVFKDVACLRAGAASNAMPSGKTACDKRPVSPAVEKRRNRGERERAEGASNGKLTLQ